ncbi:hypothetical protein [Sphingomonas xinjiangensis]|uniref:Uncharacterized protein n=1 Tax=Sphingomonas xinjiangensis TaxID=643568 RepID=A0A840YJ44_9SPHN|nr:hypothetical protein [Sphingomonas xinjiangensis]MBB5708796.1 hypothetical protein [Sphingomonas xinjiangensis]
MQPRTREADKAASEPATPLSKKEEIAARKLQEAKNAVATLAAVKNQSRDAQKAVAAKKVKDLRARLQALKLIFAHDPKKLARVAAQIARELAGAVKAYVGAGGAAAELGGSDAGADSSSATVPAGAKGAEGEALEMGSPPVSADRSQADKADDEPNTHAPGLGSTGNGKRDTDQARGRADAEFAADARALARELKAALRRREGNPRDEDDRRSAKEALASVDQAMGALPMVNVEVAL